MTAVRLMLPEIVLLIGAVVALFAEFVPGLRRSPAGFGAIAAATSAALAAAVPAKTQSLFGAMLLFDPTATYVRVAIAALTAVFLLWVSGRGMGGERSREAVSLALFAALGGMLMASANDLVTLFIAIELGTMPAYVLIGYARDREPSLEGTLKYYLLSLLTSLIMLYGLALLYALSGGTAYAMLNLSRAGAAGLLAGLFVAVGFLAKLSAAPFHYWAPDAYAGAPAASVAFVSTVPKVAGLAAMARLLMVLMARTPALSSALALAAVVSVILGNLAAYPQADIRRLMAYSGVAQVGYLLVALSANTALGASAAIFYVVVYSLPSMAIMLLAAEEGVTLDELSGLAARRPWKAWLATVFFLSLVGIPPMAGFIGKLYLFTAAYGGGQGLLVLVAVVMSVASLGYYFRVVRAMFGKPVAPGPEVTASAPAALAIAGLALATIAIGVAAAPLLGALGFALP